MKGPSSATLLALLGVAGLLPHNSVALPADHSSTTPPDPIHYNDTTSSSLQGTLQQTSQKRVFDTISITECMTKPGWWLACCNHPVSSKHGARGECRDYADRSLKLDKIGSCENDGSGHGDLGKFILSSEERTKTTIGWNVEWLICDRSRSLLPFRFLLS